MATSMLSMTREVLMYRYDSAPGDLGRYEKESYSAKYRQRYEGESLSEADSKSMHQGGRRDSVDRLFSPMDQEEDKLRPFLQNFPLCEPEEEYGRGDKEGERELSVAGERVHDDVKDPKEPDDEVFLTRHDGYWLLIDFRESGTIMKPFPISQNNRLEVLEIGASEEIRESIELKGQEEELQRGLCAHQGPEEREQQVDGEELLFRQVAGAESERQEMEKGESLDGVVSEELGRYCLTKYNPGILLDPLMKWQEESLEGDSGAGLLGGMWLQVVSLATGRKRRSTRGWSSSPAPIG